MYQPVGEADKIHRKEYKVLGGVLGIRILNEPGKLFSHHW